MSIKIDARTRIVRQQINCFIIGIKRAAKHLIIVKNMKKKNLRRLMESR
jgi:hypothetical protein